VCLSSRLTEYEADEILNDNAGFRQNGGKFLVLCAEPSVMRKQALRDVEQIDRRRKNERSGENTG